MSSLEAVLLPAGGEEFEASLQYASSEILQGRPSIEMSPSNAYLHNHVHGAHHYALMQRASEARRRMRFGCARRD